MSNIIRATTLVGRKDPTVAMMQAMVITGGRQQVRQWLASCKYEGAAPTAVPIFTLDQDSPKIKAARWLLQGDMGKEVGINARDLFTGAGSEKIFLKIDDLSIFDFSSAREGGENVSAWQDAKALEVRWVEAGHALTSEQVADRGLDKFSIRACVQPESVTGALLWLAAVPLSKEDLVDKRPVDYWTRKCPQIHMRVGGREASSQRSLRIRLAVAEGRKDECGFGIYPGLENLAAAPPLLPPVTEVREALHLFLRKAGGFNPKSAGTVLAALDAAPSQLVAREPVNLWPELPADVVTSGPENGRSSVLLLLSLPGLETSETTKGEIAWKDFNWL